MYCRDTPQHRCVLAAAVHAGSVLLLTDGWCVLAHLRISPLRMSVRHGALSATNQVRRCPRGCCTWLVPLHSLTPPVWCGSTVHITRPPARMFCDAPCRLQPLMVCHLAVLGPRAGAWACDVQAPGQGPAQRPGQLLLVCPVALVPPTRALRSPAVQVVAVRQVRKSSCRVKQFHIRSPILCPS